MFCRKCGQPMEENDKFCPRCGTPVAAFEIPATPIIPTPPVIPTAPEPVMMPEEKKKKKPVLSIVLVLIAFLCVIAAVGLFFYFQKEKRADEEAGQKKVEEENVSDDSEAAWETEAVEEEPEEQPETEEFIEEQPVAEEFIKEQPAEKAEKEKVHTYRFVIEDVTWREAYNAAKSAENSHLVTIESAEEWNTILDLIAEQGYSNYIFWVGAMRERDSYEYYWVDAKGYLLGNAINDSECWLPGEPSYYTTYTDMGEEQETDERYVDIFYVSSQDRWVWNDTVNDPISLVASYEGKLGYIIECEEDAEYTKYQE